MASLGNAANVPGGDTAEALQGQAGFERRVAWLEEDVLVLHRRLRDECSEAGGAAGDSGLRALVARLDGELSAERRSREAMESRMLLLEDSIRQERKEREAQLRGFSNELETTMRGLIARIDESLSEGAQAMAERTDVTEDRLRYLINRVDEGLSAGAAQLQETLTSTGVMNSTELAEAFGGLGQAVAGSRQPVRQIPNRDDNEGFSDQLQQSWEVLRQENVRLSEQRLQMSGHRSAAGPAVVATAPHGLPSSLSTSMQMPQGMQASGSGLQPRLAGAPLSGYAQRSPFSGAGAAPAPAGVRR